MNCRRAFGAIVIVTLLTGMVQAPAGELLTRVPNTSLKFPPIPGSPALGYGFTNALGAMTFTNPVCIVSPPGETNRLFILEKRGRVIVITNLAAPTRTVFMDIADRVWTSDHVYSEEGLLGMAFHPGYATNRYFFLYYVGIHGSARHDVLARFEASPDNPDQGLKNSEVPLMAQLDQNEGHNAGDLHFGPDGYVYLALADGGVELDFAIRNGQRIDRDFFSAILRIDVDKRPGSLPPNPHPSATTNYAVPPDNPFVGATNFNGLPVNLEQVRTEFWAVGLRNPWRMSFDPVTGALYCGDVGGNFEEINHVTKGGNYGWPYWNGNVLYDQIPQGTIPSGATPSHSPPLVARPWQSPYIAVIGGIVYRGQRMPELHGAYIYGHWGPGEVRALWHTGTNVTELRHILSAPNVTAFGVDSSNGDILFANARAGADATIERIIYLDGGAPLPPTLADTGAFANLATLTPHAGVVSYDINVPFWSDYALKTRWFSIPDPNLTLGFDQYGNWSFPTGTVWIKHFDLELTNGVPESSQRVETRFIVKIDSSVYGVTYRWGDSLTNATLVPEAGLDETFVIDEGGGILRTQTWHYPSRVECLLCHTPAAGHALGFSTAQLNRDFNFGGTVTNQIAALNLAGYFNANVTDIHTLPALSDLANDEVSLEYRVRSYLAANCAQCHQPGGTAQALWDARITTSGPQNGVINGALINNYGNPSNRVIVPGSISNSVMLARIADPGPGHMPPLATSVINTQAVTLLSAWITNDLPGHRTFAAWQLNYFGATNTPDATLLADADHDGGMNYFEYLTQTIPTNAASTWRISIAADAWKAQIIYPRISNRGFEVQSTTNLLNPNSWVALNIPANAPFFSASNRMFTVEEPIWPGAPRYYRARVFEP